VTFEWSAENLAKFRDLRASGLTLNQCAMKLGTSRSSASGKARDLKLPSPCPASGGHHASPIPEGASLLNLKAMWRNGVAKGLIAKQFKVGRQMLERWAEKLELPERDIVLVTRVVPRPVAVSLPPKPLPKPRAVKPGMDEAYVFDRPAGRCQFVTNSARPWRMCGCVAPFGRSLCGDHQRICYTPRGRSVEG
jgi:hypothetical protein